MFSNHNHYRVGEFYFSVSLLTFILFCTACSDQSALDVTKNNKTRDTAESPPVTAVEYQPADNTTERIESGELCGLKGIAEDYIKFARAQKGTETVGYTDFFNLGTECIISLQNVFGDEKPEMILGVKSDRSGYRIDYYFTMNEESEPVYMGCCNFGDEFRADTKFFYAVEYGEYEYGKKDSIKFAGICKLEISMDPPAAPDFAQYKNSEALSFMKNTHMYFIRYDDEDWDNPEEGAAMFYYEDSGSYEAYSISKQILDLTSIEINDYINRDGNHIYSYLPGENYLVSRQEYEQAKSKAFEILTEVTDKPEISSGWINIDSIDMWLDSLV